MCEDPEQSCRVVDLGWVQTPLLPASRGFSPLALGSALPHQALERQELGDSGKEEPPASSPRADPEDFIGRVGWCAGSEPTPGPGLGD